MSNRRRRQIRDEDSDVESENSVGSESETEKQAGASDTEPPNYDEAVKLETDVKADNADTSTPKSSGGKSRGAPSERKDPAFVPRSDRFFLHDNREDLGDGEGPRKGGPRKRDVVRKKTTELEWKHDKYEELIANDQSESSRKGRQQRDKQPRANTAPRTESTPDRPSSRPGGPGSAKKASTFGEGHSRTPVERTPGGTAHGKAGDNTKGSSSHTGTKQQYQQQTPSSDRKAPRGPPAVTDAHGPSYAARSGQKSGDARKQQSNEGSWASRAAAAGSASSTTPGKSFDSSGSTDHQQHVGGRSGLPAGATVHATAPTRHTPSAGTGHSARSTPVKPPPGLEGASLNPSAREFLPTDSPTPSPAHGAASAAGRKQWKYGADPASYSYATDPAAIPAHLVAVSSPAVAATAPVPPQTVSIRLTSLVPPSAAPATPATAPAAAPAGQQVSYKEHSPHVQYPAAGTHASPVPPIVHPTPADYHPAAGAGVGRGLRAAVPAEGVDMYGQMGLPHHPHSQAHLGMYRQGGVLPAGAYNVPMTAMGVPVYDPQMVYMHDALQMGHHHYGDGTVWYNMQQSMPHGHTHGHAPAQGGADGAAHSGGTVYYPLPPAAPTSE